MDKLREVERRRKEASSWFMAHKSRDSKAVSEMDELILSNGAIPLRSRFAMDVIQDVFGDRT